jgi:hypothetical protein
MWLKCLNNDTIYNSISKNMLYEVLEESKNNYIVYDDYAVRVTIGKNDERFELIKENAMLVKYNVHGLKSMTWNKVYEVIRPNDYADSYLVLDDFGNEVLLFKANFTIVEESLIVKEEKQVITTYTTNSEENVISLTVDSNKKEEVFITIRRVTDGKTYFNDLPHVSITFLKLLYKFLGEFLKDK